MQDALPSPRLMIANRRRGGWWRHLLRLAGAGLGLGITSAALAAVLVYTALAHDLPRLDAFDKMAGVGVTRFEAADGSLVGERYTERRLALAWEDLPKPLILAFLAAEDARFFEHSGIDFRGIMRAMVTNLFAGGVKEGASTITQQLAKILVGNDRNWSRKVKEAILARRMEDLYAKEQILAWYINTIYFGHHSYGVQAAAQNYFRKNVWDLTLGEMAALAGCAQSPSRVNPVLDLAGTKARSGHILDNMVELGWATADEAKAAKAESFKVYPLRDLWGEQVPDYTEAVRRLGERWNDGERTFLERGLTIRMAVDPAAQRAAHEALDETLVELQKKQGYPGPLGRAISDSERDAFFAKNAKWVGRARGPASEPAEGARLLGRVAEVGEKTARIELSATLAGSLDLKGSEWATAWSIFPRNDEGRYDASGKVSFGGKLSSLVNALAVGDIVLVRVIPPPPPPKPPKPAKPAKPPKPSKNDKKKDEPKEEPVAVTPTPEPRVGLSFALEPIPMMQGVIVSTPVAGGGIDALATGWDFDRSEVDRTLSVRPTGSTIKPIAYALAYDLGLPPSAPLPTSSFKEGRYDLRSTQTGELPVWNGLVESNNMVSLRVFVHALDRIGKGDWQRWGERLGLAPCRPPRKPGEEPDCPLKAHSDGPTHNYLAEVLGVSQRPRDMLSAYATFARGGQRPSLDLVRKVVAGDGRVLERRYAPVDPWAGAADAFLALYDAARTPIVPAISPTTSYLIAKNLAAAVRSGTGQKAKAVGREAAGKTGTLDYDVWFSGFTGERATVTWIGADDNERTLGPNTTNNSFYGSNAAVMWAAFMRAVDRVGKGDKRVGIAEITPPEVVTVEVDLATGLVARADGVPLPHRRGTEPTELVPEPVVDDTTF